MDITKTLLELGIDNYTLLLILSLPIVSTIVGIARHIVGLKTLSIYAPIVLTYAFIELSFDERNQQIVWFDGIKYGLFLFALVYISTLGVYQLTRGIRLHYFPKLSLIFTAISIIILAALVLAGSLGKTTFTHINVFSVVLIAAIAERIISVYAKTNLKNTILISLETLILTLLNFSLIAWQPFQLFLLDNPWVILFLLIVNFYVGSFTGLRLREYWRFRAILDRDYTVQNGDTTLNK